LRLTLSRPHDDRPARGVKARRALRRGTMIAFHKEFRVSPPLLRRLLSAQSESRRNGEISNRANDEVSAVRDEIIALFGSHYWMTQDIWHQKDAESGSSQIGFTEAYSGGNYTPTFTYRLIGDEPVISVSEEPYGPWDDLFRTSRETPVFDATFKKRVKKVTVTQRRQAPRSEPSPIPGPRASNVV
jgi:hypothetical protein